MKADRTTRIRCLLPEVFAVDESTGDNRICQLYSKARASSIRLEPFELPEYQGFLITPLETDPTPILLILGIKQQKQRQKIDRIVPSQYNLVLGLPQADLDLGEESLDLSAGTWIRHPGILHGPVDYPSRTAQVLTSWRGAFTLAEELTTEHLQGLRRPQVGAVYAVFAHWAASDEAATIVMPTGTGKTEVMLSVLVSQRCARLLVVVPTDALRTQIGERFLSHGILKGIGIVSETAEYPIVGFLGNRPKQAEEVDAFFEQCNVIITTMNVAGQCSDAVQQRMAVCCSHLFIDEAHHLGADTWGRFKQHFRGRRILQFTATPFRNDERLVEGKVIFNYPLKKALEDSYFKPIRFIPVEEYDPQEMDRSIARQAVAQLEEDLDAGFDHILMARVGSIRRAKEVHDLYAQYSRFNPVQLHSDIAPQERERIKAHILAKEARIIVCVDMLGEGFDLPELKIAAFHDIKKSLPITLQLTGRFTRARSDLGNPSVVANIGDVDARDELRKLYSQDADWNTLLPQSSQAVIQRQVDLLEFLEGFKKRLKDIPLQNLKPTLYTTIYQTNNTTWHPENFEIGIDDRSTLQHLDHFINYEKDTLVILLARKLPVDWADIQEICTLEWELHIIFWDREQQLLFINSSGRKGLFRKLAQAVIGKDGLVHIHGRDVIRCFAGVTRLKIRNIGVRKVPPGNITYSMYAGPDVIPGLSATQRSKSAASNLSGSGYEGGHRVSLGCSTAGRVWAQTPKNLSGLIDGCRHVGRKILNTSIDPDIVLSGVLVPKIIKARPNKMPIGIEWPEPLYLEPETSYRFLLKHGSAKRILPLFQTDIRLVDPTPEGELSFDVINDDEMIARVFNLSINSSGYSFSGGSGLFISQGGYERSLKAFFEEHPPTIWFQDGSFLEGNRYVEPPKTYKAFPRERLITWNWAGVDIHKESQIDLKKASQFLEKETDSIQYRVIQAKLGEKSNTLVFDDDDSGESADVVCVQDHKYSLEIEFYHCKFAKDGKVGYRVEDLYEVCGQAQKSVQWAARPEALFDHLEKREPRTSKQTGQKISRFERGTMNALRMLRNKSLNLPVKFKIFIVQPGMSKALATTAQLVLLAVTEDYLQDTYNVPLEVICSP